MNMSLDLTKYRYADPYSTNSAYLINMTSLQMKALKEMKLKREYGYKYIFTDLWSVPQAVNKKIYAENLVEEFITYLNNEIKEL